MRQDFTDQLGRPITIDFPPQRIVSLVPSQTELLSDLGLEAQVTGITRFCVRPPDWRRLKKVVGGTKDFSINRIAALQPDLIIANKEENDPDRIRELAKSFPVWVSDVRNLVMAQEMITAVGKITGREKESALINEAISNKFITPEVPLTRRRAAYLIWSDPFMTVGHDTFIHDMLERSGFENVFAANTTSRYPAVTEQEIIEFRPDIIFLSSEPYPFREKHIRRFSEMVPTAEIRLADGEMFSWYGSRLCEFDARRYRNM